MKNLKSPITVVGAVATVLTSSVLASDLHTPTSPVDTTVSDERKIIEPTEEVNLSITILLATPPSTDLCTNPSVNITALSDDKRINGFEPAKDGSPSIATNIKTQCKNIDLSVWSIVNRDGLNEIDFTLNLPFNNEIQELLGENFSGSVSMGKWDNPENDWEKDVLSAKLGYSGFPIKLSVKGDQLLDSVKGWQVIGSAKKSFDIGEINNIPFNGTVDYTVAYLRDFFGANGFTNQSVGASVSTENPDGMNLNAFIRSHNGNESEGFKDGVQVGVGGSYSF